MVPITLTRGFEKVRFDSNHLPSLRFYTMKTLYIYKWIIQYQKYWTNPTLYNINQIPNNSLLYDIKKHEKL